MADELEALSVEDQAYFDNRGEAPAEPEPKPEVVDPDLVDEQAPDEHGEEPHKEPKLVPLAALTKERTQARELQKKLSDIEKQNAVLADRWNMFLQAQEQEKAKAVEPAPPPNPEDDIFAYSKWQAEQLAALQGSLADKTKQEAEAKQATEREQAVWGFWDQSVKAVSAEKPDFGEAATFLSELRTKQLTALKSVHKQFSDPAAVNQQINNELRDIIIASAQSGVDPAAAIYEMAVGFGYTGKKPEAQPGETIDKIAQAVNGAVSLSNGGGARPSAAPDASAIANMSPEQFEAWLNKNGDKAFRKLAGG